MKKIILVWIGAILTVLNMYGQTESDQSIDLESGIRTDVTFLDFQKAGATRGVQAQYEHAHRLRFRKGNRRLMFRIQRSFLTAVIS